MKNKRLNTSALVNLFRKLSEMKKSTIKLWFSLIMDIWKCFKRSMQCHLAHEHQEQVTLVEWQFNVQVPLGLCRLFICDFECMQSKICHFAWTYCLLPYRCMRIICVVLINVLSSAKVSLIWTKINWSLFPTTLMPATRLNLSLA